jgi:hypothetical protein
MSDRADAQEYLKICEDALKETDDAILAAVMRESAAEAAAAEAAAAEAATKEALAKEDVAKIDRVYAEQAAAKWARLFRAVYLILILLFVFFRSLN